MGDGKRTATLVWCYSLPRLQGGGAFLPPSFGWCFPSSSSNVVDLKKLVCSLLKDGTHHTKGGEGKQHHTKEGWEKRSTRRSTATREEGREQHRPQIGRDETATLLHLQKVKHVILNLLIFHFRCTWKMLIKKCCCILKLLIFLPERDDKKKRNHKKRQHGKTD